MVKDAAIIAVLLGAIWSVILMGSLLLVPALKSIFACP